MARPLEFDRNEALERAMTVFWRQGYTATTLDDLTAAMKIKRQSLYNSFGDKRSLYLESLRYYRTLQQRGLLACLDQPAVKEGFKTLFALIVTEAVSDPDCKGCMVVNAMTELAAADPVVGDITGNAERENEAIFAEAVRRGQARGEIAPNKDPEALAAFLYNAVIGLRVRKPDKTNLERVVKLTLAALD